LEDLSRNFTFEHLVQFVALWELLQDVQLDDSMEDDISWKLTDDGQYSVKSAYKLQFLGSTFSSLHNSIWKGWVPPEIKSFTWLALQNRIGGPLGEKRVAKLRTSPNLQTNYGISRPSFYSLPLLTPSLALHQRLVGHSRGPPNSMAKSNYQALVQFIDGWCHSEP
jgi:hypothetical protein